MYGPKLTPYFYETSPPPAGRPASAARALTLVLVRARAQDVAQRLGHHDGPQPRPGSVDTSVAVDTSVTSVDTSVTSVDTSVAVHASVAKPDRTAKEVTPKQTPTSCDKIMKYTS